VAALTLGATVAALRPSPDAWELAGYTSGTRLAMLLIAPLVFVCGAGVAVGLWYWLSVRKRLLRAERGETLGSPLAWIPGQKKFEATMRRIEHEVADNVSRGSAEFTVVLTQSELGALSTLDTFTEVVVKDLQQDPRVRLVDVTFATPYLATIRLATVHRV
jgi:hypothetical protein